jgi:ADP-ribosylarginine hydrolase
LFTALAITNVPIHTWPAKLLHLIPKVKDYIRTIDGDQADWDDQNMEDFIKSWTSYATQRGIFDGDSFPVFSDNFSCPMERERFYLQFSFAGWNGASGNDAPLIAYDSLLYSCQRGSSDWLSDNRGVLFTSALHGGDSDSTAILACGWYGAMFGFSGVPKNHIEQLEYLPTLLNLADKLYLRHV